MLLLKSITQGLQDYPIQTSAINAAAPCDYPLNVKNLFPYWTTLGPEGEDPGSELTLLDLVKEYYKWLYCNTGSLTPYFGFFELEKLKNANNTTETDLLKLFTKMYIPSLDLDVVSDVLSDIELKTILNSVKNKLYGKKGTEASFKYLISLIFNGITPNDIYITYPKKYLMILNGGSNSQISGTASGYRGILNFSILRDNILWNEYTYIINVGGSGSSIGALTYERVIKPILHPAGLNDLYQERTDIFNSANENFELRLFEIPKIGNYFGYTTQSNGNFTDVCAFSTYGVKQHVFPNWDRVISGKNPTNFGSINIEDMFNLEPIPDGNGDLIFPNDAREQQIC